MSKLRDIFWVLTGDLSMDLLNGVQGQNDVLFRECIRQRDKVEAARKEGQAIGEALARGNSDKIREITYKALEVKPQGEFCTFCQRVTIHYTNGHCVQCGTK